MAADKDQPVKYWLANLPADTPLERLVRLAKPRWRLEHGYRELKQCLGLDHYEGPPTAACATTSPASASTHAFLTCFRLSRAGPHDARPCGSLITLYQAQRDLQATPACWQGYCPACQRRLPP